MKARQWLVVGMLVGIAGFLFVRELSAPIMRVLVARSAEMQGGAALADFMERGAGGRAQAESMATLAGVVVGFILLGICVGMAARVRRPDHQPTTYAFRLSAAGFMLGLLAGVLSRPSVPLVGQLPLGVVFTRGAMLTGIDLILRSTAETSFNHVVVFAMVGTLAGAALGYFVGHRRLAESSAQHAVAALSGAVANVRIQPAVSGISVGEGSFCIKCGNKLPDPADFCPSCGTKRAVVG